MDRTTIANRDHFRCFARNARWGTCQKCPHDADGHAYPEMCEETDRPDHHFTCRQLADWWERCQRSQERQAIVDGCRII
jgi:hypothetical protein